MFENIILDMGNVLLDYDPSVSIEKFCPDDDSKRLIEKELFNSEDWKLCDKGDITREEQFDRVKERVPSEYWEALRACVYHWDICMHPLPGAKDFIKKAKEAGYRLYVLSNAASDFYDYFPKNYDMKMFDGMIVSSDHHLLKPDRRIYELLMNRYMLDPSECIFIDDMQVNVDAAVALGIYGYRFDGDYAALDRYIFR